MSKVSKFEQISVRGARAHNLKNISIDIPKHALVVVTGLSGSGKSSLAFDTIYAEGQRRYAESLSAYARQFLEMQDKPDVDEIHGLSPTVAIDQRTNSQNPRSTVGTVTEVYDLMRLLFARIGIAHCVMCGGVATQTSSGVMVERIREMMRKSHTLCIASPLLRAQFETEKNFRTLVSRVPFDTFRYDGMQIAKAELLKMQYDAATPHTLEVLIDKIDKQSEGNLSELVVSALEWGNGKVLVYDTKNDACTRFSVNAMCTVCGAPVKEPEPRLFSFNSPYGACTRCTGLGITLEVDEALCIPNKKLTLAEGAILPWVRITGNQALYQKLLTVVAEKYKFSVSEPVANLSRRARDIVLFGTGDQEYDVGNGHRMQFEGVLPNLQKRHDETTSDYIRREIEEYMREKLCPLCNGKRLKPDALAVTIDDLSIADVTTMSIEETVHWLLALLGENEMEILKTASNGGKKGLFNERAYAISRPIIKEMVSRIKKVIAVGLEYLTLGRSMTTLSGGEAQRVRLSAQLSTGLTSVIYVLDEPSIGMHPQDIVKLIGTLKALRDADNSVIVVEHDAHMMKSADYIIDIGPGAGVYGGEVIAAGEYKDIVKNPHSLTGKYLSGKLSIAVPKVRHTPNGKKLEVIEATAHNLNEVNLSIPLGVLTCVTGVSGSGKSTLVLDILGRYLSRYFYGAKAEPLPHKEVRGVAHIDKVISIDQSAIGRTPRSNPATYTGVFTQIRDLFSAVPEAKARGYDAGKFSFNVRGGGRCESCAGEGYMRIPMQFLTDVFVECEECHGKRYNREALEIHYKDKTIADVLKMTVEEAKFFWNDVSGIYDKLSVLSEVGLGYVQLGQPATTLSGGEAQRVKLATELSRRATGRTLYILDEPTTGLHFEDIKRLLAVLQTLVEKGNSVLVIEHNIDVIKCADWVIDMGPGGGKYGGKIVGQGTPEDIVKNKESKTGVFLKEVLENA